MAAVSPSEEISVRNLILAASALALSACVAEVASKEAFSPSKSQSNEARNSIAYNMNDPNSAQFRNIRGTKVVGKNGARETFICGEVNAKNLMGAYVGFTPFIYNLNTKVGGVAHRDLQSGINWVDMANFQAIC